MLTPAVTWIKLVYQAANSIQYTDGTRSTLKITVKKKTIMEYLRRELKLFIYAYVTLNCKTWNMNVNQKTWHI